jgi:hypothetical protein
MCKFTVALSLSLLAAAAAVAQTVPYAGQLLVAERELDTAFAGHH